MGHLVLTPTRDAPCAASAPLIELDEIDAREHGQTVVQAREAERYEYEVESIDGVDLRLRCSVGRRRKSLKEGAPDAGLIETGSFCGTLLLELVEGEATDKTVAVASALMDVRSIKLEYRTEYRGMLRRLSEELAGLVVDARSSAKASFRTISEFRRDEGWLQIQLEFLREILDSREFSSAIQQIVGNPHERLSTAVDTLPIERQRRWSPSAIRQLVSRAPLQRLPTDHQLHRTFRTLSIARSVEVPRKTRSVDTPENRFVKFALIEIRSFLVHAEFVFSSRANWRVASSLARRLSSVVDECLSRGLFREVGDLEYVPLGSPVMQRRAGYRELLRWWLRFHYASELSWDGGEELFRAGQRDVASLYEYWLFFELLSWFCRKFRNGNRPAIEELVDGIDSGFPSLRLRKRTELGPFEGSLSENGRKLQARFSYNRRFEVEEDSRKSGSWTRRLHPDYTLTFWPEELNEAEAEQRELLVHVHFDAKYRVEHIEALFGPEGADDADEEIQSNYKRQDLLKMHAYKDAIRRSQGAYILYPGSMNAPVTFRGYHEILPGLGAFGVAPDENGAAMGFAALNDFLSSVLSQLCNRTTSLERVSYHMAEAYSVKEEPVRYGSLKLPEADHFDLDHRAPPPAEHMVLVAWYRNEDQAQLSLTDSGIVFVRLGRRAGALHVHPNIARVRHVLLRTDNGIVQPGLVQLRQPGFRIYTRSDLRQELKQNGRVRGIANWQEVVSEDDDEHIYAVFQTRADSAYADLRWNGKKILELIEVFEADARNKPVTNIGRTSPYPRILPLKDLLRARVAF